MADLHPPLTHFPIALIITACLFQAVLVFKRSWMSRSTPLLLLGLALVLTLAATQSGEDAANLAQLETNIPEAVGTVIDQHGKYADVTVWGTIIIFFGWLWLFLKNPVDHRMDVAALLFLILLSIAVGITGYLGGELVMTHGVGVRLQ